jgi:glutamate decarboxylase
MKEAGRQHVHTKGGTAYITPYSTRYASKQEISKFEIPQDGAPADAVHQMLKDELDLDGRPNLNLARYAAFSLQLSEAVVC